MSLAPKKTVPDSLSIRQRMLLTMRRPEPIRVGFVVHAMQVAGAEVLVRETIHRLGKAIIPTVFCLDSIGSIGEQLIQEGVDIICFNRRPNRDYSVSTRMAKEIRQRKIQIIHAHQYSPFFYSAIAKALTCNRFKLILTEHGRHYPDIVSSKRSSINRLVLDRFADAVNACCEFSGKALSRLDGFKGRRIAIIDNGIDIDRYSVPTDRKTVKNQLGLNPDRDYIAMVARFHPVKDHPMLLKAFAIVSAQNENVDLLLAGEGSERSTLEALVGELGISNRVHFLGVRRDVPVLLKAVDLFALTSVSEAASLTLLEAMATGCPVVVTAVGGNPELIRAGVDGLLVPRGNYQNCAQAMLRILNDRELARSMGASGRERVVEQFTLSRTIDQYYQLYLQLLGRGKRS